MKNKVLASVEIAIVLCSVFLVAIPAIAAQDQNQEMQEVSANTITTASEGDYVLGIYGNANEDDTIDMGDVVYIKLAIFGKKPKTELCDAKYDGRINVLDVIQTKLIILGKEKELTIVDSADRIVTVKKPVKRIVALHSIAPEMIKAIGAKDRVVGVGTWVAKAKAYYPEISELPDCGWAPVNPELVLKLKPDIVMAVGFGLLEQWDKLEDKLEPAGITVVRFNFIYPNEMEKEAIKLGYILDKEDEAQDYVNFVEQCLEPIKQKVEDLTEEEKPRVYLTFRTKGDATCNREGSDHWPCVTAGGINIAADLAGGKYWFDVDPEWVLQQDPEIVHVTIPTFLYAYAEDDPTQMMELRKKFIDLPGWENINAVRNDRVYLTSYWVEHRPSYPIGIAYMAKRFHPDLFEDLDPEAIHQEYLTRFQGLDYNLDEHGIFVYPPIIMGKGKLAGIPDRYYDSIVAQP